MHFAVPMLISFIVCVTAIENPEDYQARAYDYEPQYEYNGVDQRFFRPTTTTTTTSTSTSTVTCTRSVANPCGGRRRRDILDEENSEEHQFPISPSVVQRVEPTSEPIRDARAANPQLLLVSPGAFGYQPQSAYYNGPYHYRPMPIPYYDQYVNPFAASRLFFSAPSWLTVTRTTTATIFTISTSTSVPACSAAGSLPQCPNA